tara:strand:- start:21219 stop:22052 length:834 start_codon:yes stop_codon:yes gene_type:complete
MKIKYIVKFAAMTSLFWGAAEMASAEQMFLKAKDYRPMANTGANIQLLNGTFERSVSAVPFGRLQDIKVLAGEKTVPLTESQWNSDKTSSYLSFNTGAPGTYTVGVSTKPRVIEMSRDEFQEYMEYEGINDALLKFQQESKLSKVRERYSKHVRAFLQVGDTKSDDYKQPLGHPLEIILEENPYNLRFGKTVNFQVLLHGKPLSNQSVKASYEGFHAHDKSGGHITSYDIRTDDQGRGSFLLSNKAVWYISLISMQVVDDEEADYESNWATVTFHVK